MKKFYFAKHGFAWLTGTALLSACIIIGSCSTGEASAAAAQIFGGSSQAPLFLNCKAVTEDEIEFAFSREVKVISLTFDPDLPFISVEDGQCVKVTLENPPKPGIKFTADLLAEDENRNTINVLVPFKSRNNQMPKMIINELRVETSTTTKGNYNVEFIEFVMKTAGNLGAARVFIASNPKNPVVYEFMPVDVKQGERVVLHLRTRESGCIDEFGALDESGGTGSSVTARDFWIPDNNKLLRDTDAVYVLDQDDRALCAVMLSKTADSWWMKTEFAEAAEFLFNQGAWKAADGSICRPADAIISAGNTATRTICRDEKADNTNTAADWYITDTSCATPGKENNSKRYVPKT